MEAVNPCRVLVIDDERDNADTLVTLLKLWGLDAAAAYSGGEAIVQVYNRRSWLNALSKLMNVGLEHDDAPVLLKFSIGEFQRLVAGFRDVRIVPERFPVHSRLHKGWKGAVYNKLFVGTFNALPRPLVERFGWHLLAFCRK